ncbi:MAG: GtrA family protein [Kiritimatiellae bacterium]|nr:GtrA family protein [Kiritimatiellia bacterium]
MQDGSLRSSGSDREGGLGLRLLLRSLFRQLTGTTAHPLVQFGKYAVAGAIATGVDAVCFRIFALFFSPDTGSGLSDAVRARHFVIDNVLAFLISNLVAYLLNIVWVFKAGRHKRWVEVAMFYVVSGASVAIGVLLGNLLIACWGWEGNLAYLAKMVAALTINFALRKFVVFKG